MNYSSIYNQLSRLHGMRNGCFEAMRSYDTPQIVKEAFLRAAERYTAQINHLNQQTLTGRDTGKL